MPADAPTILATSGGIRDGRRTRWEFSALTEYAIDLAGVAGRAPRLCLVATALGDNPTVLHYLYEAAQARGLSPSHLTLFPMPNVEDITAHLLDHDVVWVFGGSVAGLLAMWRLHGVDAAMRAAWHAGVVLTGISAGSICWHIGGTTDSFGPDLQPVTDGLALVPYANGVHYDSEEQRRPLFHRLIGGGTCPPGMPPTTGRACCTAAPISSKRSANVTEPPPISSPQRMAKPMKSASTLDCSRRVLQPGRPSASASCPDARSRMAGTRCGRGSAAALLTSRRSA